MKILLAVDGSRYSEMSAKTLKAFGLPSKTKVTVMTVVSEHTFLGGLTLHAFRREATMRERARTSQEEKASRLVEGPAGSLRDAGLQVQTLVERGRPAEVIIQQADKMGADLIVVGAKGTDSSPRFQLGSVSHKVMKYARTSVLLVREGTSRARRVFLATDGSRHAEAAAKFILTLPLPRQSLIILVTSLQSYVGALMKMPTLDLETNQKLLAELQAAEEQAARSLMAKTERQLHEKGYQVESLVLRGDPAEEILLAAKTLNPDLIVLGAKGLTGIETFLLGSVAQRVARFSRYSVLLVRPADKLSAAQD
ncbi:MAG: universal stress protein [Dehalococcoidia bacterium]|nr:universal stress protein [Dehalococcoidia bacterium]